MAHENQHEVHFHKNYKELKSYLFDIVKKPVHNAYTQKKNLMILKFLIPSIIALFLTGSWVLRSKITDTLTIILFTI